MTEILEAEGQRAFRFCFLREFSESFQQLHNFVENDGKVEIYGHEKAVA